MQFYNVVGTSSFVKLINVLSDDHHPPALWGQAHLTLSDGLVGLDIKPDKDQPVLHFSHCAYLIVCWVSIRHIIRNLLQSHITP